MNNEIRGIMNVEIIFNDLQNLMLILTSSASGLNKNIAAECAVESK